MLILKESEEQVDWRKEDVLPRYSPMVLENVLKLKFVNYAKIMNILSGSFDLMVDAKENVYFLECNPIGKFNFLSIHCGYFIEERIVDNVVKFLKEIDYEE